MKPVSSGDTAHDRTNSRHADESRIQPASFADVASIKANIDPYAARDLMLPRSTEEVFESIREYRVCKDESGIIGSVALHIFSPDIAEVRALAVKPNYLGRGIGTRLVETCLDEARGFEIPRAFTLTLEDKFFAKLGFHPVDRNSLTLKVWQECYRCPKFDCCDEVAMVMDLT